MELNTGESTFEFVTGDLALLLFGAMCCSPFTRFYRCQLSQRMVRVVVVVVVLLLLGGGTTVGDSLLFLLYQYFFIFPFDYGQTFLYQFVAR